MYLGALFHVGDLHAAMGDGEICGIGVEIAGEVTVKADVIKGFSLERPCWKRLTSGIQLPMRFNMMMPKAGCPRHAKANC